MKILYITSHYNPFVPRTGSDQRYNLLLHALARIGQVDVVTFADNVVSNIANCSVIYSKNIPFILPQGRWIKIKRLLRPFSPYSYFPINKRRAQVVNQIVENGNYDLIVTRYIPYAFECDLMRYADRLVIDVDDNPVDSWMTLSRNATSRRASLYYKLCASLIKGLLPDILGKIRHAYFPNNEQLMGDNASYLPNVPFYEIQKLDRANIVPHRLLFVGDLRYRPNYLGVEHFVEKIFPQIRSRIPDVQLHLAGRNYGEAWVAKMEREQGVRVLGFVNSLEEEYAQANVCVVPVYSGAGTNIKVLEALQAGRACVLSEEATRGFSGTMTDGTDYCVAHTDEEFAEYVCLLLVDEKKNERIARNGAETVCIHYSKKAFNVKVATSLLKDYVCH